MAVTGFIGLGYVVAHSLGNLQAFEGPAKLNAYAAFLKSNMGMLWAARTILLAAVILHISAAYQLWRRSAEGRPIGYQKWKPSASTYASRTMRWSGPILGLFIVYHLLHLTTGTVHPNFQERDVYSNVVSGFKVWYVSAAYIFAMLCLSLHMYHGIWSMFQSLGINHPRYNAMLRWFSIAITIAVVIAFIAVPAGVLAGILQ